MPKVQAEAEQVFVFTCKEILTHGITREKRECGKVIRSISRGQFDYWVQEHKAKHAAKKRGIKTSQALASKSKAK
jgi:hypothetical protein